jgi:hypothetical protein
VRSVFSEAKELSIAALSQTLPEHPAARPYQSVQVSNCQIRVTVESERWGNKFANGLQTGGPQAGEAND